MIGFGFRASSFFRISAFGFRNSGGASYPYHAAMGTDLTRFRRKKFCAAASQALQEFCMRTASASRAALPTALRRKIAATAKATELSTAEVMRKAIVLGLPAVHQKHKVSSRHLSNVR